MSSYVTKTYTVRPDMCRWHYRTANGSTSYGAFFNDYVDRIWDGDNSSYGWIIDYDSPSSRWGVMSFRLNTSSLPANVLPQTITAKFKISYGALSSSDYYASASLSSYNISFEEANKASPTQSYSGNSTESMSFDMTSNSETARNAIANNTMHLVFRLRCASNLDSYRRFYELYTTISCRVYTYSISVNVNTGDGGTVTGGGTYEDLSTPVIIATPKSGYEFAFWNDGDRNATRQITVTSDTTYTAYFRKVSHTIIVEASPSGGGTVTGSGTYDYGAQVTLTAVANENMRFDHWSNGSTSAQTVITVNEDATYIAYFVEYIPAISSVLITPNPVVTGQGFIISVGFDEN